MQYFFCNFVQKIFGRYYFRIFLDSYFAHDIALVDDLASHLSRFLFFLVISQDSFAIPSIQDSCLKKQVLTFWWYSCRQNLGWRGKKCLTRQDSCVLEFLPDSFSFLKFLPDFFFLFFFIWFFFYLYFLPASFILEILVWFLFFSWIWYVY